MKQNLLIPSLLLAAALGANAQTANVQIIHNSPIPAADSVDIYVYDGMNWGPTAAVSNLKFRQATSFVALPSGNANLRVAIAPRTANPAIGDTLASFAVPQLANNTDYVAIAAGDNLTPGSPTAFNVFFGGASQTSTAGNFGITIFHGSTDAPGVGVFTSDNALQPVSANLTFGNFTTTANISATDKNVLLTGGNDFNTMIAGFGAPLATLSAGGLGGVVFASGYLNPANGPAFGLFVALPDGTVLPLPAQDLARVQIIHNCPDPAAASVDIYLYAGGALATKLEDVAFRTATPYLIVPATTFRVVVAGPTSTDTTSAVVATNLPLAVNTTSQVIANGLIDLSGNRFDNSKTVNGAGNIGFGFEVLGTARVAAPNINTASVYLYHQSPDAPAVDVVSVATTLVLAPNLTYGNGAGYLDLPSFAGLTSEIDLNAAGTTTTVKRYQVPLGNLAGVTATVFASGFLTPNDENVTGLADFGAWVALPSGGNLIPLQESPLSVTNITSATSGVVAFPVPAQEVLNIQFNSTVAEMVQLDIMDIHGRVVSQLGEVAVSQGANNLQAAIQTLASGQYIARLSGDQINVVIRFVK